MLLFPFHWICASLKNIDLFRGVDRQCEVLMNSGFVDKSFKERFRHLNIRMVDQTSTLHIRVQSTFNTKIKAAEAECTKEAEYGNKPGQSPQ